ncbi:conserved hypothetical protein [Coccidioides posadasii str. Silveira]|uniref:Uncharacterized protein n=1 Tax=Coccidioides posadasii (strain RMSCC 757 / Silveira) TaxID=443226 RepID=E9DC79_COCPS|nr:conserved hypothetical protein [Coccidioides posadasii str. Silveira]
MRADDVLTSHFAQLCLGLRQAALLSRIIRLMSIKNGSWLPRMVLKRPPAVFFDTLFIILIFALFCFSPPPLRSFGRNQNLQHQKVGYTHMCKQNFIFFPLTNCLLFHLVQKSSAEELFRQRTDTSHDLKILVPRSTPCRWHYRLSCIIHLEGVICPLAAGQTTVRYHMESYDQQLIPAAKSHGALGSVGRTAPSSLSKRKVSPGMRFSLHVTPWLQATSSGGYAVGSMFTHGSPPSSSSSPSMLHRRGKKTERKDKRTRRRKSRRLMILNRVIRLALPLLTTRRHFRDPASAKSLSRT